ncbi:prepilin-type N-terminal cleavage/methylation domain-containing protein [Sulfurovum sp. XTW-4]|uniref:Prepilin-type N-terminal cleavage/methylation domain-containing protein n=1 Tax=Sulfurovum xiamenensis TaxID=3019066 RepID=A0ABT7QQD9_9BACT|nr:prepilin-type N-terminal cleavage/methylation domain-containing protein [Sulfurovum xiamenensis]MDM5263069.1 prepilin-type N-terminal cleavage/methylation domain-containing protein [Sulfurovum xiamenensis]
MKIINRRAFTMIELVFVIVVIGILAAIAVPKLAATRDDAKISKARATVGALRSAIATERQKRILKGNYDAITTTEAIALLEYPLGSDWSGLTWTAPDGSTCTFTISNNKLSGTCAAMGSGI